MLAGGVPDARVARLAAARSTTRASRSTIPTNVRPSRWKVPSLNGVTPCARPSTVEAIAAAAAKMNTRFMVTLHSWSIPSSMLFLLHELEQRGVDAVGNVDFLFRAHGNEVRF